MKMESMQKAGDQYQKQQGIKFQCQTGLEEIELAGN